MTGRRGAQVRRTPSARSFDKLRMTASFVPANRIGHEVLSLAQLKIIQEAITLTVFVPFAIFYMRESWSWNYLWAGLCIMGAVFFIFREPVRPRAAPPTQPIPGAASK